MPAFKECRRLVPDPDNEPDFYAISLLWPVAQELQQVPAAASKSSEATHAISNEMLMSLLAPASASERPSALKSVDSILALPRAPPEAPSLFTSLLTTMPAPSPSALAVSSNSEATRAVSNDMLMSWLSSASQKPATLKSVERNLAPRMTTPQAPSFVAGPSVANTAAAVIIAAALRLPVQPQTQVATVRDDAILRNPVQPQAQDTVTAGNAAIIAAALQNPDWFRQYMGSRV
jgi:hypothetical protein